MEDFDDFERSYGFGDVLENGFGDGDGERLKAVERGKVLKKSDNCNNARSFRGLLAKEISIDRECSMCGDIGIREDLFQCKRCLQRYQHIYCSRSYPNLGSEKWICNWCLHAEDKIQTEEQLKQAPKRKAGTVGEIRRNDVFEFLLQIAQSLPETGSEAGEAELNICSRSSAAAADVTSCQGPKRQRCNNIQEKSRVIALHRWRPIAKSRLKFNQPRGIGRRYKLLADVLC